MKRSAVLALIIVLGFLCYIPFINKALHVDSDMAVTVARQMVIDPINPPADSFTRIAAVFYHPDMPENSVFYRCHHPPLVPYALLPAAALGGEAEWPYHLTMLVFYLSAIAAMWVLTGLIFPARERAVATMLWAMCPALLVNSTNVMFDVAAVSFILWGFTLLATAIRSDKLRHFAAAGVAFGLGALTKETIFPLYVVTAVYLAATKRWRQLIAWGLPAAVLPGMWVLHNVLVLGKIQYLSTGLVRFHFGDMRYIFERNISYAGGCIVLPLWWLWLIGAKGRRILSYIPFLVCAAVWSILLLIVLHKPPALAISYTIFASTGFWALCATVVLLARLAKENHTRIVGRLGLAFFILQCLALEMYPMASVRHLLPLVPFIIICLIASARTLRGKHNTVFAVTMLICTLVFSISLACGDYLLADAGRELPRRLRQKGYNLERTWYMMGPAYYLHRAGCRNLQVDPDVPRHGDNLIKYLPHQADLALSKDSRLGTCDTIQFARFPLRTEGHLAGFYGADRIPYSLDFHHPVCAAAVCVVEKTRMPAGSVTDTSSDEHADR